ncbi:hypothetical protein [Pseudofrankia inefficax]|uniref:Uncharacterized protein n=1 Tax=Pseudofrankia inefficax (strain DSM 45817 / CECT 9037 / DDB 130130 / EuI1c) TaxID=298654 RepID=E3IZF9_PSEI1|nr:hypothetical protein [Pseudofrankia inefficax]ADP82729.1 hypothetical protein FraEuI1c_4738 [Pseudofrankia inefficax]
MKGLPAPGRPAGPPAALDPAVARTAAAAPRGRGRRPVPGPAPWPTATRASLFTVLLVTLGLACGLVCWLGFEQWLIVRQRAATLQVPPLVLLAAGLLAGLARGRRLARPTTLIAVGGLLTAASAVSLALQFLDAPSLTPRLAPACVACFGAGVLVTAAARATGRGSAVVVVLLAVVLALALGRLLLGPAGQPPRGPSVAADPAGRPYYTWERAGLVPLVEEVSPDAVLGHQLGDAAGPCRLLLCGVVTGVAALGGTVDAVATTRSRRRATE